MEENKVINMFEKALTKKELLSFILGLDEYMVVDREYGNHWPLGSYKNYIEPILINDVFPEIFWEQLYQTLASANDINILLDNVVAYLIPYYNSSNDDIKKIRVHNTPLTIINQIKELLVLNKESLLKDNRGTGVSWNSSTGMWGGITANLLIIKKREGPSFLPDEFI